MWSPWGEGLPCHHTTCCLKGHGRKRKAWCLRLRSNLKNVKMFYSVPTSSSLAAAPHPPRPLSLVRNVWKSVQTLSANQDGPTQTYYFQRLTLVKERQNHNFEWLKMRTLVPAVPTLSWLADKMNNNYFFVSHILYQPLLNKLLSFPSL